MTHILELPREIWYRIFEHLPYRFFVNVPPCKRLLHYRNTFILLPERPDVPYDWERLFQFNFQLYGFHRRYVWHFTRFIERMHIGYLFTHYYKMPVQISANYRTLAGISESLTTHHQNVCLRNRASTFVQNQLAYPVLPNSVVKPNELRWYVEIACNLTIGDAGTDVCDGVSARDFLLLPLLWPNHDVPRINASRFQKGFETLVQYDNPLLIGLLDQILSRLGSENIIAVRSCGIIVDICKALDSDQWNIVEFAIHNYDFPFQMNTARIFEEIFNSTDKAARLIAIFKSYPHVLYRFIPAMTVALPAQRSAWLQLWLLCYENGYGGPD